MREKCEGDNSIQKLSKQNVKTTVLSSERLQKIICSRIEISGAAAECAASQYSFKFNDTESCQSMRNSNINISRENIKYINYQINNNIKC